MKLLLLLLLSLLSLGLQLLRLLGLLVNGGGKGEIGVALLSRCSIGKWKSRSSKRISSESGREGGVVGMKGGAQAGVGARVRLGQLLLVVVGGG